MVLICSSLIIHGMEHLVTFSLAILGAPCFVLICRGSASILNVGPWSDKCITGILPRPVAFSWDLTFSRVWGRPSPGIFGPV